MCDATTALYVATALSAYSSVQQGEQAKDVAQYNAREQENQATQTRNKGVEEENIHRQKVAQLRARQRAQLGANNIDIDSGSAIDLQEDTQLLGEVDALRIRRNYSDQAEQMERQAELTRIQGDKAQKAGYINATATVLGAIAGGMMGGGGSTGAGKANVAGTPVNRAWYNSDSSFFQPYSNPLTMVG